jgi:hypothetical protein
MVFQYETKSVVREIGRRILGVPIYSFNFTVEYISKFKTMARVKSGLLNQFNAVVIFSSLETYDYGSH